MGKCAHSAVINAPVDQVWRTIGNFHDMSWSNAIESLDDVSQEFCDPFYTTFLGHLNAHYA